MFAGVYQLWKVNRYPGWLEIISFLYVEKRKKENEAKSKLGSNEETEIVEGPFSPQTRVHARRFSSAEFRLVEFRQLEELTYVSEAIKLVVLIKFYQTHLSEFSFFSL